MTSSLVKKLGLNQNYGIEDINSVVGLIEKVDFNPDAVTYETLISSGILKLLGDFKIKSLLAQHYSSKNELKLPYIQMESIVGDYLANYLIKTSDYRKISKGQSPFMVKVLLTNILQSMNSTYILKIHAS